MLHMLACAVILSTRGTWGLRAYLIRLFASDTGRGKKDCGFGFELDQDRISLRGRQIGQLNQPQIRAAKETLPAPYRVGRSKRAKRGKWRVEKGKCQCF
ncbi:hypothetical protein GGR53DRAFT_484600, partial [Hypoxylon sp. FL1150]